MNFPDTVNKDFSKEEYKDEVQQILDYAVANWNSRASTREDFEKLYDSYNGIIDKSEIKSVTNSTGKTSKTKYVKYRLGRSKLKQLHGEFLNIPISSEVSTTNRDAQNRRMNKYKSKLGLSLSKPYVEQVRNMGYDVFSGVKIPDEKERKSWTKENFVLTNEIVMSTILRNKINNERLKAEFYNNFIDLTIVAEVFGRNEKDVDGNDTYRFIPANFALYEESVSDPFLKKTPYIGEVRPMYYHEILTSHEFDLNENQKEKLKEMRNGSGDSKTYIKDMNGQTAIFVYTIEFKGVETVRKKTSYSKDSKVPYKTILSEEYYNKNKAKIDRDVKNGVYELDEYYRDVIWSASRIGEGIYTVAKKEEDIIQIENKNGKFSSEYSYSGMLFSTVDGYRVSLQKVIHELEKIYDDIRFSINKELKKPKGSSVVYDEAFIPKGKQYIDVFHSIDEDGILRYNSTQEGNKSGAELDSNKVGVGAINLGGHENLIALMNQAMDIERVMDRITGMNDSRQGLEKATTTATTNINNVEASRSMTYDLFYFMKEYIEIVLMKLCEKAKLNIAYYGDSNDQFLFSDEELQYIMVTKDLLQDNYSVRVTDGKKEREVLDKIEQLFPQEINAGNLRTMDVAKFLIEPNFSKAIKVLDEAHQLMAKQREREILQSQQSKQQESETKYQIAKEDREDKQEHEREMEVLRTEGKKEIEAMKQSFKATIDTQNNLIKASMQGSKKELVNPFE